MGPTAPRPTFSQEDPTPSDPLQTLEDLLESSPSNLAANTNCKTVFCQSLALLNSLGDRTNYPDKMHTLSEITSLPTMALKRHHMSQNQRTPLLARPGYHINVFSPIRLGDKGARSKTVEGKATQEEGKPFQKGVRPVKEQRLKKQLDVSTVFVYVFF